MGQDPYGNSGGFTPYQPDATPDSEPAPGVEATPAGPAEPYVPYGGTPAVPYGGSTAAHFYTPTALTTVSAGRRILPWVIGIGVLVVTCGGGVAGIVGAIAGAGDVTTSSGGAPAPDEVYVNDLLVGQCLSGAGFATDEPVSALAIVPCSSGHDTEVLAINPLDSKEAAAYDFNDDDQLDATCRPFLTEGQKKLLNDPDYFLVAFTETETPVTGDQVACLLRRADGTPLIGTWDQQAEPPQAPIEPS